MTTLDDRKSKSFDVVLDAIKLLLTLSTAIIGYFVSAIMIHKADNGSTLEVIKSYKHDMSWALVSLGLCVFFSLCTIFKICGELGDNKTVPDKDLTIYEGLTRWLFGLSFISFMIAIVILGKVSLTELFS